jgi:UDP-2,3-diacylglucosamine pyrophosphatase LpxH
VRALVLADPPSAEVCETLMAPALVRSLFLSDVHLGTRACQAERLLEFLDAYEAESFLLGDIVDLWAMRRGIAWSASQTAVVRTLLARARHGTTVVFIPGNHDAGARMLAGTTVAHIRVEREHVHTAADGRRYLLLHGDACDPITTYYRWLAVLGDRAYATLVRLNRPVGCLRRALGLAGYWSLAGYAKRQVKTAVAFIADFEAAVIRYAKSRGVDGVICGHVHTPAMREVEGLRYLNCGDWVDSGTAIVEHLDGRMELVRWGAGVRSRPRVTRP